MGKRQDSPVWNRDHFKSFPKCFQFKYPHLDLGRNINELTDGHTLLWGTFCTAQKKGNEANLLETWHLTPIVNNKTVDNDNDVYVTMGKAQLIESDIDSQADQQQDVW